MSYEGSPMGNLAGDPEVRVTASGKQAISFRFIHNESKKNKDGVFDPILGVDGKQISTGFEVEVYEGSDSFETAQSLNKGDFVKVTGQVYSREYANKEGAAVRVVGVRFPKVEVLRRKGESGGSGAAKVVEATVSPF